MSYSSLTTVVDRIKRIISKSVISGTYSDEELEYFVQDANLVIPYDYTGFGSYSVSIGSGTLGINPDPSDVDSLLLSFKAASLAYMGIVEETAADAVMVRAGSIQLDTSRSLRARSDGFNRISNMYQKIVDDLIINGSTSVGYRIDNYIETSDQENISNSESLL